MRRLPVVCVGCGADLGSVPIFGFEPTVERLAGVCDGCNRESERALEAALELAEAVL